MQILKHATARMEGKQRSCLPAERTSIIIDDDRIERIEIPGREWKI